MSGKTSPFQRRNEVSVFTKLLAQVEELEDENQVGRRYQEFRVNEFIRLGDQAVLVDIKGQEVWMPFSQLRKFDDDLYVTNWIMEQKGID
jgi:hypothetical protein